MNKIEQSIAKAILKAAHLREASWDDNKRQYQLGMEEACSKACIHCKLPERLGYLLYLALDSWWNDTIGWAETVIGESVYPA